MTYEVLLIERVEKTWGYYEVLLKEPGYLVKKLYVKSGALMSLQRHFKRSEHWIVVSGRAIVYDEFGFKKYLKPDDSVYIGKRVWHSFFNLLSSPLIIIEIQMGSKTEEEDIERVTESCMPGDEKYDYYSELVGRGYDKISTPSMDKPS